MGCEQYCYDVGHVKLRRVPQTLQEAAVRITMCTASRNKSIVTKKLVLKDSKSGIFFKALVILCIYDACQRQLEQSFDINNYFKTQGVQFPKHSLCGV